MSDGPVAAGEPLPAAAVVLIREGSGSPEIFMVKRHARAAFGACHVFPGGVVDRQDRSAHIHCRHVSASEADEILGVEDAGLDYYSAAIRELFEETGVLLAKNAEQGWAYSDGCAGAAEIDGIRRRLNKNEACWTDILCRYELTLACESLHYFAFWVTPETEARRFSARFFAAVLPVGQEARHDDKELTDGRWMTAAEALRAADAEEITLIDPTCTTLRNIEDLSSVPQIIDWARRRVESGAARLLPAFVEIDGKDRIVMPGEPHYPEDEPL
jgi:8-oxo-dGTP pyrophosphatase MutT (NUDIX family)